PSAVVLAQFRAILVDNHARAHANAGTQKGLGVAIRDKADVIRIWLGGGGKSVALSFFANLWLRSIPNWEVAVGQLFGGNYAKNIRLVLVLVQGATHVAIFVQGGVVAGGHGIEAQRHALAQKCSELNLLVAAQTRVRGFTTGVAINEVRDNGLFEFLGEVPDRTWDASSIADAACIRGVLKRAAAAGFFSGLLGIFVQGKVDTDHLVSCFNRTGGSYG